MKMSWKTKAVSSSAPQHSLKVKLRSRLVFSVSHKTLLAASICSRLIIYVVLVSVTSKCSEMSVGSDCELLLRRALLGPLHGSVFLPPLSGVSSKVIASETTEPRKVHADIQLHQQPTKQTKSPEPSQTSQL